MPVKKKPSAGKKKKEVLADPQTLPAGRCNYYIASWSQCQNIDGLSDIARILLEQNTNADGEVGKIPRTNVLIPAGILGRGDHDYKVEVADNMYIESVPLSVIQRSMPQTNNKADMEGGEEKTRQDAPMHDTEGDASADGNKNSDDAAEAMGASKTASAVNIRGKVDIVGVLTQIVVKPDLPDQPVMNVPKKGSKRKKSLLQEEEQRFAEAMKEYEGQVEKLVVQAKKRESQLMQFAHPDRWPQVTFVNLSFAGPVTISQAHVKFQNCAFNSRLPQTPQLLISQYCKVECHHCTFAQPIKCGVYVWPRGAVALRKCLFTGASADGRGISARFECPRVVGLHGDACGAHVEDCVFAELGTGILLRGEPSGAGETGETGEAPEGKEGNKKGKKSERASAVVRGCRIEHIYGVGLVVDNVSGVEVARNKFSECEHYALDFVKGSSMRIVQNVFWSELRVHDQAEAKILGNEIGTVPLSSQHIDNPNWKPVY